jgi:exopolyphosphatase
MAADSTVIMSSSSKFVSFIKGIRHTLERFNASGGFKCALVVAGNESADLDSSASSLVTAYMCDLAFRKSLSPFSKDFTPSGVFPVFNIKRSDLKLRPDVVYLLGKLGIREEDLLFLDDIVATRQQWDSSYVFLVDHNVLTGELASVFEDRVAGILDHHADENRYSESITAVKGPRLVQTTGSCSSHVVNYWYAILKGIGAFEDQALLEMAMAPVVADTSNLRFRTEVSDRQCMDVLKRGGLDPEKLTKELDERKRDISGMSSRDLLRKDYKEWTESGGKVGFSTIVQSLEWIYSNHEDFDTAILNWSKENNLDVCAIMTSFHDEKDRFSRQLGIVATTSKGGPLVDKFLRSSQNTLNLGRINLDSTSMLITFSQQNVAASRKQVAPLMRQAMSL